MPAIYQRPESYEQARSKFRASCRRAGCEIRSISIAEFAQDRQQCLDLDLTIDVAILAANQADSRTLVISSGMHGVEGFVGSQVQQHFIKSLLNQTKHHSSVHKVLIHGINPFGFKYLHRWNEDRIDLNRNFLHQNEPYQGSPDAYHQLMSFINPAKPPTFIDDFWIKAPYLLLRHGLSAMTQAIAIGQYDYPAGLFFGGHAPSASMQGIDHHIDSWLGSTGRVLHLDFHSGLGRWQEVSLFLESQCQDQELEQLQQAFPQHKIRAEQNAVFRAQGQFGRWLQTRFHQANYQFLTVEFGTLGMLKIFQVLRKENQAYHYLADRTQEPWRRQLFDAFAPPTQSWWQKMVPQGVTICLQALDYLQSQPKIQ